MDRHSRKRRKEQNGDEKEEKQERVRQPRRGLESESSVPVQKWFGVIVARRYIPAVARTPLPVPLSEAKALKTTLAFVFPTDPPPSLAASRAFLLARVFA